VKDRANNTTERALNDRGDHGARFVLIVVDMLNDFFRQHGALDAQKPGLVRAINEAVRVFRLHKQPIIWVRQEFAPDLSDGFLDMRKGNIRVTIAGTDGCEILSELDRDRADRVLVKQTAFS
jgi:maleamate amidohydrolase